MMAIAFWFLPLRILTYSLVASATAVVWLQGLDGVAAGIYGVIVIALAADLTRGRGRFNALAGIFATALACGGVVGPLISGVLLQQFGFKCTFYAFAGVATTGALIFTTLVPETSQHDKAAIPTRHDDGFSGTVARPHSVQRVFGKNPAQ